MRAFSSTALGTSLLVALCVAGLVLATRSAQADRGRARQREPAVEPRVSEDLRPPTSVAPTAPPSPTEPPRASQALDASGRPPRSAFAIGPGAAPFTILARRPGGVLVGDHAIAFTPYERGGTWSSVSLASGIATTFPAPVRVVPSGTVGVLADNVWPVGDVLVAHDGRRAMLIRADGAFAPGETRPHASTILGAASVGSRVIVWWRLDAIHTELEALDGATARTLWRRPGPPWAWDARLAADDARVALLSSRRLDVLEASGGARLGGLDAHALGRFRSGVGWPHPFAMGGGVLVLGSPSGVGRLDLDGRPLDLSGYHPLGLPSIVAADDTTAFAVHGDDLVALDLARGDTRWVVRVAPAASVHPVSLPAVPRVATHLVLCDAGGGAIVLDAATGAALLRVGVGGCTDARARSDGTIAIAGARETWIVGPAAPGAAAPRARRIGGIVTLDGVPAAGLPVLIGAAYPIDGLDGCPAIPAYARCVLTDDAGRFAVTVRARGLVPITVDLDAAAHRAGRPRAIGGSTEIDLETEIEPHGLRLEVRGADEEM